MIRDNRDNAPDVTDGHVYRYPMVSVAADIVLLNLPRGAGLRVALVRRRPDSDAFANQWALPGGFLKAKEDQDIQACVRRELFEEVGVENPHLELVGVYSDMKRDPRERVLSVAWLSVLLSEDPEVAPISGTDVVEARWVPLTDIANGTYDGKPLAFDHAQILADALRLLHARIPFGPREEVAPELLFAFLPEEFTLGQATEVMTHLKGRIDQSNFRKYIQSFVEPTGGRHWTSTRSAALYRRRRLETEPEQTPHADLRELRRIAADAQIRLFDLFLATLESASRDVVRFMETVLIRYTAHRDYAVDVSRTPELRITDRNTGRPLVSFAWDPRRGVLIGTALAEPDALDGLGLAGLEPHPSGAHRSRFNAATGGDGAHGLDKVLWISRAALVSG